MYSIINSVVLLFICFAVEATSAAENGYILQELSDIPCEDSSSAISPCSGSLAYKIPDFSKYPNIPNFLELEEARKRVPVADKVFSKQGGEKCRKAATKYLCELAYPFRCEDTYVGVDGNELVTTCDQGRKDCSSLDPSVLDTWLNCSSSVIANISGLQRIPRKLSCEVFPVIKNDPYPCKANYKVC